MKDNKKKIILCPNPNRDQGMLATKAAEKILRESGFYTVPPLRTRRRVPLPTATSAP